MTRTVFQNATAAAALLVLSAGSATVGAQTSSDESHVTFTKDVAPIFQRACQACHRPGQMGPMSLLTYEEVRPWARSIRQKVSTREMPPWYLDRTIGVQEFKNDASLSNREIETISAWVDAGAPRGNPADLPAPREFDDSNRWTLPGGEPDLVVYAPEHTVKGNSHEEWLDLYAGVPLTEDRWVRAYEAKPAKEAIPVVHHLVVTLVQPDGTIDGYGLQYAPGKPATVYPEDSGWLLKAGTEFRFGMHYSSIDEPRTDRSSVAFQFYPKGFVPKKKAVRHNWMSLSDLDLPAGEKDIRHDDYRRLTENFRLMTYLPHMHTLGQRQCIELIYPSGEVDMLNCFNFNFGWQTVYQYEEDAQPLIPKGTLIHAIHYHDNSMSNPLNPDPENWTGYGNRTIDDMAITMAEGIVLSDEEFEQAQQERAAAPAGQTQN